MAQHLHPKYKVTHPLKALQLLRFTSIPGEHHDLSSQLPRTTKPLLHSQPANIGGGRALGPRTNPRVLPPFWWHDPVATTDLHRDSWWKMQWRKINPELVPSSLTQFFILRKSEAFILVRFRDPSVVTFSIHGWLKLSKHSGALLRSQPWFVLLIDSKARNPSWISPWPLIPGIKISSWAVSLISLLWYRAQEKKCKVSCSLQQFIRQVFINHFQTPGNGPMRKTDIFKLKLKQPQQYGLSKTHPRRTTRCVWLAFEPACS